MALHWYGRYTREQFAELDGTDQSRIVALYLIQQQTEGIIAEEHLKEMKRQNQQQGQM